MLTALVVHEITVAVDNICYHPGHCRVLGADKIDGSVTKKWTNYYYVNCTPK